MWRRAADWPSPLLNRWHHEFRQMVVGAIAVLGEQRLTPSRISMPMSIYLLIREHHHRQLARGDRALDFDREVNSPSIRARNGSFWGINIEVDNVLDQHVSADGIDAQVMVFNDEFRNSNETMRVLVSDDPVGLVCEFSFRHIGHRETSFRVPFSAISSMGEDTAFAPDVNYGISPLTPAVKAYMDSAEYQDARRRLNAELRRRLENSLVGADNPVSRIKQMSPLRIAWET